MVNRTCIAAVLALAFVFFAQSVSAVNTKCNVTIYAGENYTGASTIYGYVFKGTQSQAAVVKALAQAVKSLRLACTVSPVGQRTAMLRVVSVKLYNNAAWTSNDPATVVKYPYQTGVYPNVVYTGAVPKITLAATTLALLEAYAGDVKAAIFNKGVKLVVGGVKA